MTMPFSKNPSITPLILPIVAMAILTPLSLELFAHEGGHGPAHTEMHNSDHAGVHDSAHTEGHGSNNDPNEHMNAIPFEDLVADFESADRAEWQKPDIAINALGDLDGKTVMDIGSGTGYFSFKMVDAGAKVICADVDERFLGYIQEKRDRLKLSTSMELRHVPYDSANLSPAEVDMVLIVDTYHHIGDRENYFAAVREGIKPGGKLVIIDFKKEELPMGPPVSMKLDTDIIVKELRAAGYENIEINHDLLPYQFMIFAS